ncbi:MAG: hypothetical protein ACFFEY_15650 [Candidatus Thorarchaeota archaeon]
MNRDICLKIAFICVILGASSVSIIFTISISSNYVVFDGTGEIVFIGLEGGFFGIKSDDGEYYDPINLLDEFKIVGLRVLFLARIRTDVLTYHMWGKVVELLFMREV